jgi:uncharacterized hydrophobic protein (TIGR00271 family)
MRTFVDALRESRFTPELVPPFEQKLFFEGGRRRPYLERFGVLLFLSVVIATAGVLGDSTATVIGAMLVAPLMTPIMATTAALTTGRMDRAGRSLLLVGAGVAGVVALSWLLGLLYTGPISFTANSQIAARISPRLLDLVAALAAGAAGAFCLSREDVADSLPGVAIAISLVPPLCVVGISLSAGEWAAAAGALLLFVTNMLAILLAGGGVLALLGLPRAATVELRGPARRTAYLAIAVATLIVAVPLAVTGHALNEQLRDQQQAQQAARAWLGGTDFTLRAIQVSGDTVQVTITGAGSPPPFASLVAAIARATGRPVVVELETVPSQKQQSPGGPAAGAGR